MRARDSEVLLTAKPEPVWLDTMTAAELARRLTPGANCSSQSPTVSRRGAGRASRKAFSIRQINASSAIVFFVCRVGEQIGWRR